MPVKRFQGNVHESGWFARGFCGETGLIFRGEMLPLIVEPGPETRAVVPTRSPSVARMVATRRTGPIGTEDAGMQKRVDDAVENSETVNTGNAKRLYAVVIPALNPDARFFASKARVSIRSFCVVPAMENSEVMNSSPSSRSRFFSTRV